MAVVLVDAEATERYRGGCWSSTGTTRRSPSSHDRLESSSTCRGRRASPTVPSSSPRSPTASPCSPTSPTATTRRPSSTGLDQLGVAVVLDGDRAVVRRRRRAAPPRPRCPHRRPPRRHDVAVPHRPRRRRRRAGGGRRRRAAAGPPDGGAARRARRRSARGSSHTERAGQLPVEVTGPLGGGTVALAGDVSSQFITALMLVGPVLDGGVRIELTTPLVSAPVRRPHRLGDGRLRCRGRGVGAHDRRGAGALPRSGVRRRAGRVVGQLPDGGGGVAGGAGDRRRAAPAARPG